MTVLGMANDASFRIYIHCTPFVTLVSTQKFASCAIKLAHNILFSLISVWLAGTQKFLYMWG